MFEARSGETPMLPSGKNIAHEMEFVGRKIVLVFGGCTDGVVRSGVREQKIIVFVETAKSAKDGCEGSCQLDCQHAWQIVLNQVGQVPPMLHSFEAVAHIAVYENLQNVTNAHALVSIMNIRIASHAPVAGPSPHWSSQLEKR